MSNNQSFIRERKRERDSFSRLLLLESESARGRRCARRTFSKCPRRAGTLPPLWKTHTAVTFPSDLIRKSDQGCRASPWHEPTRWRLSVEIRWTTAKFGRNHQSTGGKRKRKDSATPKSLFFFSFVSWRPKKFKSRATALKTKPKKNFIFEIDPGGNRNAPARMGFRDRVDWINISLYRLRNNIYLYILKNRLLLPRSACVSCGTLELTRRSSPLFNVSTGKK